MGERTDIEPFGTLHGEVDFRNFQTAYLIALHCDGTRFPGDFLSFTGQFLEGDTVFFDGGDHGGNLIEVTLEAQESSEDIGFRDAVGGFG